MENLINLYGENEIKPFQVIILYTTYGISFYYPFNKVYKINLQFIYLNNLTPQNFFDHEPNNNGYILEKMFEEFIKTGKTPQLLFDNIIKTCSLDKVIRYLNLYIKDILINMIKESKTLLIAYNEDKFFNFFKEVPITKSLSLYENKKIIYVDFGYLLEIRYLSNTKKYQNINIKNIILKFREFLSTRYKIKISSYRAGKILKSLSGLKSKPYCFYGPIKFVQIASEDLLLFFKNLLRNISFIIRKKKENLGENIVNNKKGKFFITNSFFTHKTTMDILDLIIIYLGTKRKRKDEGEEEEKVQIFTYGMTLNLKKSVILGFLKTNKIKTTQKECTELLQRTLDKDKNMIYQFLMYLKTYHSKEYSMIDSEFVSFISIKFKDGNIIIPTVREHINKYKRLPQTLRMILDKDTIFDFIDPQYFKNGYSVINGVFNQQTFLESVIKNKMFYFLKFNVFYVFGENFSSLRMLYLGKFRRTFNQIFKKIKGGLTPEDIAYYKENVKYFTSDTEDYIPKLKRRKIS